jgi:hypothetical protein
MLRITAFLCALALGCSSPERERKRPGPPPIGPGPHGAIASSAAEAWPDAPALPPLAAEDVASACLAWARCNGDVATLAGSCVRDMLVFSAERAIPITFLLAGFNERVESFVPCVLAAPDDCSAVEACLTPRLGAIVCQEDGCLAQYRYSVTCEGSVARLETSGNPIYRDCALAFAQCDPESHTGCTDRPFSQCDPALGRADRCDGDIRLGCDGKGQVSYRDCSRLGGSCQDGACVYPTTLEPPCATGSTRCSGGALEICVTGEVVSVEAPDACP